MTSNTVEIKTAWDGTWIDELNTEVGPRLKGMYFSTYPDYVGITPAQTLIKVVIEPDAEYFKNELKFGGLDKEILMLRLEAWITHDWGYDLFKPKHLSNKPEKE